MGSSLSALSDMPALPRRDELLTYPEAARIVREATKDKSYRAYPMGGEAGHYLRWKRGRLTKESYRSYESALDKLARAFPDLKISDFEPPVGTERVEEHMDTLWGDSAPKTYNKNLGVYKDFFRFSVLKGGLHGDPTLPILYRRERMIHRETFSDSLVEAIIGNGPHADFIFRDRCCLRLLLFYALRKGALRKIQFKHFDHNRRRLTVFTKGEKVQTIPIPEEAFWHDLERLILDIEAKSDHFLLCRQKAIPKGFMKPTYMHQYPEQGMGDHGAHNWWYGCLARAGVVTEGTTAGERMHKSRHTAGQRVLDVTKGNLKAAQALLGHANIATTANIYTNWDIDQLEQTMREVTGE